MTACVTGATGFLGAHIARLLCERGEEVRVTCRDPRRPGALDGSRDPPRESRRPRLRVASHVRSKEPRSCSTPPATSARRPAAWAWQVNAEGPLVAVEAAAAAGCRRVVLTSSISAIGLPSDRRPADERTTVPERLAGAHLPRLQARGRASRARRGRAQRRPSWSSSTPPTRSASPIDRCAAADDLLSDRRQLPARTAAGRDRGTDELRRRRGRRDRAPAGRRPRPARRALHPRRAQHDLAGADRSDRRAVRRPPPGGRAAARGRPPRADPRGGRPAGRAVV